MKKWNSFISFLNGKLNFKARFHLVRGNKGFTLLEFLIAMSLFGTVLAITSASHQGQLKTYYYQKQVADMQQNIRAALFLMNNETKKAGLDPTGDAGSIITAATQASISFTMDFDGGDGDGVDNDDDGVSDEGSNGADDNGNGLTDEPDEMEWFDGAADDQGENVTYRLSNDANVAGGDGINDALQVAGNNLPCHLIRIDNNIAQTDIVAYDIDALNFVYLDEDKNVTAVLPDIRSVEINIVGRPSSGDSSMMQGRVTNQAYQNSVGFVFLPNQGDDIPRMMLSNEVFCRNMGLN